MKMLKGIHVKNWLLFKLKKWKMLVLQIWDLSIPFNQLIIKSMWYHTLYIYVYVCVWIFLNFINAF